MDQAAENIISDITKEEGSRFSIRLKSYAGKLSAPVLQFLFDFIAILLSFAIQYYIRFESGLVESHLDFNFSAFTMTASLLLVYWIVMFFFTGLYKNWYIRSPFDEFFTIFRVAFFGCFILVFGILSDSGQSPRLLFLIYFLVFTTTLSVGRLSARRIQRKLRSARIITIPALITGTAKKAREFYEKTRSATPWGYNALGVLLFSDEEVKKWNELYKDSEDHVPLLGQVDSLEDILEYIKINELIISADEAKHSMLLDIVSKCADNNVSVKIDPDIYDIFMGQARAQNIYGIPLIEISTQLLKPWQEVLKRIFDISFSLAVILLGLPIWLLTALVIKLDSKGPVFYKQPRVGKGGKIFEIYKYRSMVTDADKQKQKWTSVNDPRVTRLGRFLRKSHIDEVPQFWNCFLGDMSVVGPRPEQPQYVEEFSRDIPYYRRRLKVRPGITGWWQVKYQPHVLDKEEIENRLKDDFYYIENMSLKLDIEIVIRTVWCVLRGHGQT